VKKPYKAGVTDSHNLFLNVNHFASNSCFCMVSPGFTGLCNFVKPLIVKSWNLRNWLKILKSVRLFSELLIPQYNSHRSTFDVVTLWWPCSPDIYIVLQSVANKRKVCILSNSVLLHMALSISQRVSWPVSCKIYWFYKHNTECITWHMAYVNA